MKKMKFVATLMALAATAGLAGCSACDNGKTDNPSNGDTTQTNDSVKVGISAKEVTLKEYQVAGWNFTQYFSITDDGKGVSPKEYIDATAVKAEAGEYTVTCTYKGKTASVKVIGDNSQKLLTLSVNEI